MARVEPSALSIPSSRVLSRTVIESALKTRKAPTKSEVPAKKRSAILNPCNWPLTCWVRVSDRSTCSPSPSFLSNPFSELRDGGALRSLDGDAGDLAPLVEDLLAEGQRHHAEGEPAERTTRYPQEPDELELLGSLRRPDRDLVTQL